MKDLLSTAGRAFLRTFGPALLALAIGILAAPDLDQAYLVAVAGLIALGASAVRLVQGYVPRLTFARYVQAPYGRWLDAFSQAAASSFLVSVGGFWYAPDLATLRSLGLAALIGALTAGAHAVQDLFTKGELPAPEAGVAPPQ